MLSLIHYVSDVIKAFTDASKIDIFLKEND